MASDCAPKPGTFHAFVHMINRSVGILWVFGVATCREGGFRCRLEPAVPPGINPGDLILNLVCEHGEPSTDVILDVPVMYVQAEMQRPPTTVTIEPGNVHIHVAPIST